MKMNQNKLWNRAWVEKQKSKKFKRFLHTRYIRWLFWSSICKCSTTLRDFIKFYDYTANVREFELETYSKYTQKYNLKEIGHELTDAEKELINLSWNNGGGVPEEDKKLLELSWHISRDHIVDFVTHDILAVKLTNATLIGENGNIIYKNKIINHENTNPSFISYDIIKPNLKKTIKKHKDELFFSIVKSEDWHKQFYHFFIDYLVGIFYLLKALPDTPITIITNKNLAGFQKVAYDYIMQNYPHVKMVEMPKDEIWEIPNLAFVSYECNVHAGFVDKEYLEFLKKIFIEGQDVKIQDDIKGNRYYISRNDTEARNIINEDELVPILEEYGFKVIYPTKYSHKEQVEMFANAEAIVAPAGAAFTNLLYARPETKVVGFYPSDLLSSCHMWTCKGVGIKYHKHIISGKRENRKDGHYRVEKEQLINALEDMFK